MGNKPITFIRQVKILKRPVWVGILLVVLTFVRVSLYIDQSFLYFQSLHQFDKKIYLQDYKNHQYQLNYQNGPKLKISGS